MVHKTKGIVFHQVKYSETSVIAKIYTESFGLQSYMLKGIRSSKSKVKVSLLQHLSLVDMVVYHSSKPGLQNIKEIKPGYRYNTIPFDIKKSSIVLFLNELLYKTIREEAQNSELFEFIENYLIILDKAENNFSDFHLHFIIQLTKYLGFFPNDNYSESNLIFNIKEGAFQEYMTDGSYCLDKTLSYEFYKLLNSNFGDYYVPVAYRKELLGKILEYYFIHISGLSEINSNLVLETVFN